MAVRPRNCGTGQKGGKSLLATGYLAKSNVSISKSVSEQKAKVKKLEYKKYVDAKASRTALLEKEEQHKRAIALLCENHTCDIEAAFAVVDEDTNKNLETDKLRLIERGKQLILVLIVMIQTLMNLLQQKRNGLTIIGGPPN